MTSLILHQHVQLWMKLIFVVARLQTKLYFSGAIILVYLAVADFLHIILGVKQENHGRSSKVENETNMYMFDYSSALRVLI